MTVYEKTQNLIMGRATMEQALESMVDCYGIDTVIDALSSVCYDKADHLQCNWQDSATTEYWDKVAGKLAKI